MIKLELLQNSKITLAPQLLSETSDPFWKWKFWVTFNFLRYILDSLNFNFNKKNSSCFSESRIVTNFQAETNKNWASIQNFGASHGPQENFSDTNPIFVVRWLQNLNFELSTSAQNYQNILIINGPLSPVWKKVMI